MFQADPAKYVPALGGDCTPPWLPWEMISLLFPRKLLARIKFPISDANDGAGFVNVRIWGAGGMPTVNENTPVAMDALNRAEIQLTTDGTNFTNARVILNDDEYDNSVPVTASNALADLTAVRFSCSAGPCTIDNLRITDGDIGPPPENLDFTWDETGAGDWNVVGNWDPSSFGAPPGDPTNEFRSHHAATFGNMITANSTVYTDSAVSLRSVFFDNSNSYIVAGTGSVNIIANTNPSPKPTQIAVASGAHQFQAVVNLGTDTTVDVAGGSTLEFNNRLFLNSNTLTKTGAGTLAISDDVVSGGGTINLQQGTVAGAGTVGGDVNNDGGTVSPGNQGLSASAVPEPATWMMLALGAMGCFAWTRKQRRR